MLVVEEISLRGNNCGSLVTSDIKEHFRGLSQDIEAMDCMEGSHAQLHSEVAQLSLDPATVRRVESIPLGISGCARERENKSLTRIPRFQNSKFQNLDSNWKLV
jgi:hypothetical protein